MDLFTEIKEHPKVVISTAVVLVLIVMLYMWWTKQESLVNLSTLDPEAQKLIAYHQKIDPMGSSAGRTGAK